MRNNILRLLVTSVALLSLPTAMKAAAETQSFIFNTTSGNGLNLVFNKFNVTSQPLIFTLTLTSITLPSPTPYLAGQKGTPTSPVIPTATFTETLTLPSVSSGHSLTATDNYTGQPIYINEDQNIVLGASSNNFVTGSNPSSATVTNVASDEGSNGTFTINLSSAFSTSAVNAIVDDFSTAIVMGTVTVDVAPEPSSGALLLGALGLLLFWRLRAFRALS